MMKTLLILYCIVFFTKSGQCVFKEIGGVYYAFYLETTSWEEATVQCTGGSLLTLTSAVKGDVYAFLNESSPPESGFAWTSGICNASGCDVTPARPSNTFWSHEYPKPLDEFSAGTTVTYIVWNRQTDLFANTVNYTDDAMQITVDQFICEYSSRNAGVDVVSYTNGDCFSQNNSALQTCICDDGFQGENCSEAVNTTSEPVPTDVSMANVTTEQFTTSVTADPNGTTATEASTANVPVGTSSGSSSTAATNTDMTTANNSVTDVTTPDLASLSSFTDVSVSSSASTDNLTSASVSTDIPASTGASTDILTSTDASTYVNVSTSISTDVFASSTASNDVSASTSASTVIATTWSTAPLSNVCDSNPCLNGQCQAFTDFYICVCAVGYRGLHCNILANASSTLAPGSINATVAAIISSESNVLNILIGVSILVAVATFSGIVAIRKTAKRNGSGQSQDSIQDAVDSDDSLSSDDSSLSVYTPFIDMDTDSVGSTKHEIRQWNTNPPDMVLRKEPAEK